MSLSKKRALVTGASRGIGQAIALELARMGATVIGTATTDIGAEQINSYLKEAGYTGYGWRLQVSENGACEQVLASITKEVGAIDILINNAGITRDNLLIRMKDEEWDDLFSVNLRPLYTLSKGVIRDMMKARWGRIINISSVVGAVGNAGQVNYASTKSAMLGFTKSLAREVGSRGITVNAIAPGFINSDMTQSLSEVQKAELIKNIALGRLGSPQDIADAVGFLVSNKADYITGCTLHVNGGMFMN